MGYVGLEPTSVLLDGSIGPEKLDMTTATDEDILRAGDPNAAWESGGHRENIIINGNFNVAQRGTSFAAIANGIYNLDRWVYAEIGAGIVTITQDTDTPDEYSESSLKIDVTTVDSSIAVGDKYTITQKIEGLNTLALGWGTSDARTVTLSFWVKGTKTGVHCVSFRNSATDRSYVAEYTINTTNTWEQKSITVSGDTSGTWLRTNGVGINISFTQAMGSTFHASAAGAWEAGNFFATSNQVNAMDSTSNNFLLSRVKLEIGSSATPFVPRQFGDEVALCERYYQKGYNIDVDPGTAAGDANLGRIDVRGQGTNYHHAIGFRTTMRTTPTAVIYNPTTGGTATWRDATAGANLTAVASSLGMTGFRVDINPTIDNNILWGQWVVEAEL